MRSALPFVIAIVLATIGALLPEAYLPWLVLLTVILMMVALWLSPPDARHTLKCPVCGFRKRVKAPAGSCPILHDCPYCGAHTVPGPDDPCAIVFSSRRRPGRD